MKKWIIAILLLTSTATSTFSAGWEMICPGVDIRNVVVVNSTWFGIQRIQQGTVVQMLLVSSVDKGYTWQPNSYFKELYTISAYKNKLMVYADRPTERGFYLSTNTGLSWKKMVGPFNTGASSAFMTDAAIFVTIQKNPGITSPVYRSIDGGNSFQPMTLDVGTSPFNFGRNYGNMTLCNGLLFVYVGRVGVFRSEDGGTTWVKMNAGLPEIAGYEFAYNNAGMLSQVGNDLFLYLSDTDRPSYSYVLKNGVWEISSPDRYSYSTYYADYVKEGSMCPLPTAYREPYLFSVNGVVNNGGGIHYTLDKGKSWYNFADGVMGASYVHGILIDGNYVYSASYFGFGRRKLVEAKNYFVKKSRTELNKKLPTSPEEFSNLLNLIGAEALEELIEQSGVDPNGLYNSEMKGFMTDYSGTSGGGLLGNSQPGTCSFMGMPSWSINIANLKLFVRDVLLRKKGKGPELQIAMNFLNKTVLNSGLFGKRWRFDYESSLTKRASSVLLSTGTGANFIFSNNAPLPVGASPFTLPCLNNSQLELQWSGSAWIVSKNRAAETQRFAQKNDSVFILKELVDSYNNKTTITHNAQGLISSISDASNRQYTFYNSNGHCDSIAAPDARKARFVYTNNLLVSASDFDKVQTTYTYNTAEDLSMVDIAGKQTGFEYNYLDDTNGMVSAVIDPENRRMEYNSSFINDSSLLTTVNYPGERLTAYTITNGLVRSAMNSAGEEKNIFYNKSGTVDSLVYYDHSKVTFSYDIKNNIIAKKDRKNIHFSYQYDNANNLIRQIKLPTDTIFSKTYNSKNQLTSIVLPGNLTTSIQYDGNGALSGFTSPGGSVHSFARDGFGNILSYTNPLSQTTSIQYDATGFKPVSRTDFAGNTYGMDYDGNGRLTKINLPGGATKSINYDCCTQTGMTDENGKTISVTRDATNRILAYHYAEGWSYTTDYDSEGSISGFTNKYGMQTRLKYNQRGKIVSVSDDEGDVLFDYNNSGNPTSITDKKGNVTLYSYNANGKSTEITDALGAKVGFEFGSDNKLTAATNARGQKMELFYNKLGLVKEKKVLSTTVAAYTYNNDGQLSSYSDATGITQYQRNAAGFVTKITYPGNIELSFTYDVNGNLLNTIYPNGLTVSNQCNALNRITKISWGTSWVDFTYNPAGYMLTETRNNGTKTNYSYNNDNITVGIEHQNNNIPFASETVSITAGIINSISTKSPINFTSAPQQLLGAVSNKLNQLTGSSDGYSFTYDADGNMTAASKNTVPALLATYNSDNQISSLQADNQNLQLVYDAMRYPRRMIAGGVIQNLYYDHKGRLLFETDAAGNVVKNYIYKGKRLVAVQSGQNPPNFYHSSRLGHVLAITGTNGAIVNAYQYSANGEVIGEMGPATNRFTFLGVFGGVKLSNNYILTGARVYHPLTGRYIQRDPMGILTGTNPYLYAGNNPVTGIDPLGFDDVKATVNTLDFDPPSDNNYGNAAGTANPYSDDLPYRSNDWDTYGSAAMNTLVDFSNHPVADLLPSGIGSPVSILKAIDKLAQKEYGGALWQFVPFNNSLEAAGNYIMDEGKKFNPGNSSGLGIIPFDNKQTFSCDL